MLTSRQKRFIDEYLIDLNATQAAIRAGYSARNAGKIGPELVGKTRIAAAIQQAMAKREERTQITQDDVIRELVVLLASNVKHYEITDDGNMILAEGVPESAWRAVSSMKTKIREYEKDGVVSIQRDVEFRLWDKVGTARLAAQHLGMLLEKVEHSGYVLGGDLSGKTREELEALADAYRKRREARQAGTDGGGSPGSAG